MQTCCVAIESRKRQELREKTRSVLLIHFVEAVEQKRYLTYNSQHITTKEIETYDPKISYMGGEVFEKRDK